MSKNYSIRGIARFQSIGLANILVNLYEYNQLENIQILVETTYTNLNGKFSFSVSQGRYILKFEPDESLRLVAMYSDSFLLDNNYYIECDLKSGYFLDLQVSKLLDNSKIIFVDLENNFKHIVFDFLKQQRLVLKNSTYSILINYNKTSFILVKTFYLQSDNTLCIDIPQLHQFELVLNNKEVSIDEIEYKIIPQNIKNFLYQEVLNINQNLNLKKQNILCIEQGINYYLRIKYKNVFYIIFIDSDSIFNQKQLVVDLNNLICFSNIGIKNNIKYLIKLSLDKNTNLENIAVIYFKYDKQNKFNLDQVISTSILANQFKITNSQGEVELNLDSDVYSLYILPFMNQPIEEKFIQQVLIISNGNKNINLNYL